MTISRRARPGAFRPTPCRTATGIPFGRCRCRPASVTPSPARPAGLRDVAALPLPGGAASHWAGSIGIRLVWFVVPDPPLVRRGLGVALRRVLPLLLAAERSDVEVAPGAPHRLVTAVVDEVGAEHLLAIADERVRAMPLVHAEVSVEVVRDGVPRHLPAHPRLHALNVRLRRARDEH